MLRNRRLSSHLALFAVLFLVSAASSATGEGPTQSRSGDPAVECWVATTEAIRAAFLDGGTPDTPGTPDKAFPPSVALVDVRLRVGAIEVGRGRSGQTIASACRAAVAAAREHSTIQALRLVSPADAANVIAVDLTVVMDREELPLIEWSDINGRYAPGLDALWVCRGSECSWMLPETALARDAAHGANLLLRCATRLGIAGQSLPEARRGQDIRIGRATALRLSQAAATDPPGVVVYRSQMRGADDRSAALSALSRTTSFIASASPRTASLDDASLRDRMESLGLADRWSFERGQFEEASAGAMSQALSALAMMRAHSFLPPEQQAEALRSARAAIEGLCRVAPGESDPATVPMAQAFAVAAFACDRDDHLRHSLSPAALEWLGQCDRAIIARITDSDPQPHVPLAVDVYAAAMKAAREGTAESRAASRLAIGRAWDTMEPSQSTAIAPWLLLASHALASAAPDEAMWRLESDHRPIVAQTTALLRALQWSDSGAGARQVQLVGAFLEGPPPVDPRGSPQVGERSALHTLALLAAQSLEGGDQVPHQTRAQLRTAIGYLTALPVDELGELASSSPGSLGAVGAAPWAPHASIGSTALVILALAESVDPANAWLWGQQAPSAP